MSVVGRCFKVFGRFWWEFLVGDTPELLVATLVIIAAAYALRRDRVVAITLLLVLATGMLLASTYRGRRQTAQSVDDSGGEAQDSPLIPRAPRFVPPEDEPE